MAAGPDGSGSDAHLTAQPVTVNAHRAAYTIESSGHASGPAAMCQLFVQTKVSSVVLTLLGPTTTCAQLEHLASQLDPIIGDR